MAEIILNVDVREGVGTGGARAARRAGSVPGILYGGDKAPVAISVNEKDFRKSLYTGKLLGHLVTLKYGDETQPVIAKAVDMHPVTDEPWHFDLYRVDEHQQIKIEVPVHFQNADDAPGIKRGGTLNVVRREIEVLSDPDAVPEAFEIDVAEGTIGDTFRWSNVKDVFGTEAVLGRDFVVATLAPPTVEEEVVIVAPAPAAPAAPAKKGKK